MIFERNNENESEIGRGYTIFTKQYIMVYIELVGGFNHLEKYEKSVGVTIPNIYGKNVPNHQPVNISLLRICASAFAKDLR